MKKKIFNIIASICLLCSACKSNDSTSSECQTISTTISSSNTQTSTSNLTYVTVKFIVDDATLTEDKKYYYGEEIDLSSNVVSKPGYKFTGWYLDEKLTTLSPIKFIVTEDITLYAGFYYNGVSITYKIGNTTYKTKYYDKGTVVKELLDGPSKVGYTFNEWTCDDYFDVDEPLNEDVVLTADYSIDELELPYIEINTENNVEITSKENYITTTINIGNTEDGEYDMDEVSAKIKGRGNSTWEDDEVLKKPYMIKFDEKQSLLGSTYKAKKWVLLANYFDKSLSRNTAAFEMASIMDHISFSPSSHYVDVYINGEYKGVYLLTDKIESGKGRVDIDETLSTDGNTGYLLELDQRLDEEGVLNETYFKIEGGKVEEAYSPKDEYCFGFKTPDSEDESFIANRTTYINYISNYMNQCFTALNGTDYNTVKNLIDVDTFAETYIIQELFASIDVGSSSYYLVKDKNGKLQDGPIWDFDLACGNINYGVRDANGEDIPCPADSYLWAKNNNVFYSRLLKYQEFVELVTDYLWQYEEQLSDIIDSLSSTSTTGIYNKYKDALERNFIKWDELLNNKAEWLEPDTITSLTSISEQMDYVYTYLKSRLEYVKTCYPKG